MAIGNIAGIAELRKSLDTTNSLLEQVLAELRHTNQQALLEIRDELRQTAEQLLRQQ